MRIIGGIYKRRRFEVPKNFKLRPTTDFAKENLFNVLQNLIDFEGKTVLDLFSGTGSISFEFASRGCEKIISVEKSAAHCGFIQKVIRELNAPIHSIKGDALKYISNSNGEKFDIIFADPPYALKEMSNIPDLVFHYQRVKPGGLFILEHSSDNHFEEHPFFLQHRLYGSVNFTIFQQPEQA